VNHTPLANIDTMVSIAPPAHDEVRASRKTMQELPIHHTLPAKKATWRALLRRAG